MNADLSAQCGKAVLGVTRKELRSQIKFSSGRFLGGLSHNIAGDVAVVKSLDNTSNKQARRDTRGEICSVGI